MPTFSQSAKDVYNQSDDKADEQEVQYNATQTKIAAILAALLASDVSYTRRANSSDIRAFNKQLKRTYQKSSKSGKQLIQSAFSKQKIKSVADLAKAQSMLPIVDLAEYRKQLVDETTKAIPQLVRDNEFKRTMATKVYLGNGKQYTPKLTEKAINKIVRSNAIFGTAESSINKDTLQLMRKVQDLVDTAVQNKQAPQDFAEQLAKSFTGKGTKGKAALGRANAILRTHASYMYTNAKYLELENRGAYAYMVLIGSSHPCPACIDMDGTTFLMTQFEVGSTAPPFHVNCQCDIEEIAREDFVGYMNEANV